MESWALREGAPGIPMSWSAAMKKFVNLGFSVVNSESSIYLPSAARVAFSVRPPFYCEERGRGKLEIEGCDSRWCWMVDLNGGEIGDWR
jgi:hypothetical protein